MKPFAYYCETTGTCFRFLPPLPLAALLTLVRVLRVVTATVLVLGFARFFEEEAEEEVEEEGRGPVCIDLI